MIYTVAVLSRNWDELDPLPVANFTGLVQLLLVGSACLTFKSSAGVVVCSRLESSPCKHPRGYVSCVYVATYRCHVLILSQKSPVESWQCIVITMSQSSPRRGEPITTQGDSSSDWYIPDCTHLPAGPHLMYYFWLQVMSHKLLPKSRIQQFRWRNTFHVNQQMGTCSSNQTIGFLDQIILIFCKTLVELVALHVQDRS